MGGHGGRCGRSSKAAGIPSMVYVNGQVQGRSEGVGLGRGARTVTCPGAALEAATHLSAHAHAPAHLRRHAHLRGHILRRHHARGAHAHAHARGAHARRDAHLHAVRQHHRSVAIHHGRGRLRHLLLFLVHLRRRALIEGGDLGVEVFCVLDDVRHDEVHHVVAPGQLDGHVRRHVLIAREEGRAEALLVLLLDEIAQQLFHQLGRF
mmetsp:Transcript_28204/g.65488  ORF Transcript_28204/g.65488 Transcript_28204/m.65488 type:complete len:207 (-) Transcript_28204:2096-2716(-)